MAEYKETLSDLKRKLAKLEDRMSMGVLEVKTAWVNMDEEISVRTREYREELNRKSSQAYETATWFLGTFLAGSTSDQETDQAGPSKADRDRNREEVKGEEK